ncbi:MAG TPA: competence protein ComJ [Pyrinomonadaceae bacterium]
MLSFDLEVSYSQICVFHTNLQSPFNDWTDEHVKQGFSWRPGSVCFRMLEEFGSAKVLVELKEQVNLRSDTIRAFQLPFVVPQDGLIEVASVADSKQLKLNPGSYSLAFETGLDEDGGMWCFLSFLMSPSVEARILRADAELNPRPHLLMTAEPAL